LYDDVIFSLEQDDDEIEMNMCDSGMIWFDLGMWWWI
jgi:hypothetical protein